MAKNNHDSQVIEVKKLVGRSGPSRGASENRARLRVLEGGRARKTTGQNWSARDHNMDVILKAFKRYMEAQYALEGDEEDPLHARTLSAHPAHGHYARHHADLGVADATDERLRDVAGG